MTMPEAALKSPLESDPARLALLLKITSLFSGYQSLGDDCLIWDIDADARTFTCAVICNELFWWACADAEELTPENFGVLESSLADLEAAGGAEFREEATTLFCCRVRGMRPQNVIYDGIDPKVKHLFAACGPERQVGVGNAGS